MIPKHLFWSLVISALYFPLCGNSQTVHEDSTVAASSSYQHAVAAYRNALKNPTQLYNGGEYNRFRGLRVGHPFYLSETFQQGAACYQGEQFNNLPLLYDIWRDEVVLRHFDQQGHMVEVQLHKNRLTHFTLPGHSFINISVDSVRGEHAGPGFYEVLYDATSLKVLCKRSKKTSEEYNQARRAYETEFLPKNDYLLFHDGIFHSVKSKGSVLKVFQDHKKALNQHLKKSGLKFRKNREQAIVEMATYYNQLQKSHD